MLFVLHFPFKVQLQNEWRQSQQGKKANFLLRGQERTAERRSEGGKGAKMVINSGRPLMKPHARKGGRRHTQKKETRCDPSSAARGSRFHETIKRTKFAAFYSPNLCKQCTWHYCVFFKIPDSMKSAQSRPHSSFPSSLGLFLPAAVGPQVY